MIELIKEGGAFVWVLLALAFVATVVTLERILFFQRTRIHVGDLILGLSNHVRKKAYGEAMHEAARAPGPVARVAHATLMRHHLSRADLRDIAREAGQLEVPRIEKNLRGLYTVALVAPLVGMMGTVTGLIYTFQAMSDASTVDSTQKMTQGVYESLVTTAFGLMVAVPAYLMYLYFLGRAKRLIHRIERAAIELVNVICDAREQKSEIVAFSEQARQSEKVDKEAAKGSKK
ncbi:biopolymer transport protein ExbB [Rubritalea squalenifaciens DSM 18772]|uniref:Biopolymer transport protein ExbB n=2 Tax=Rubritalea TaxID=361050 RepID=A0A1M6R7X4_9BACT|nr:MotA/TolQ/ExbB proton channel family protein [Rubritalea squalenifaciens]SHK28564.1 biopolymer transport protein ExbB [Rubritalea squalenifaciens DSM 18772]